jgi:very-short-patch-repair endonuclease
MKKLLSTYSHLVKEWHPTKNEELTPNDFTFGSHKKVWWLCSKGHSYDSIIFNRTRKNPYDCPYCSGKRASKENNLQALFPEIAKEWHPEKNGDLTPNNFTHGSGKEVWWLCPKGHSYEKVIGYRTGRKYGCHYCSGKRVSKENNIQALFPEIAKEWHPEKNGDLTPNDFTYASSKRIWWLCPKKHSYETPISYRTSKNKPTGCPYCSGRKASKENNIQALFPEIAKEWHPEKNGDLTPNDFTYASSQKIWWLCSEGHSYESMISNKTAHNSGCPYCSGNKVSENNNVQILFPEISKEWHPTKNKELTPKDFTYGSHKKVWWLCPKHHSYQAAIKNRTKNNSTGCPYCTNQTSEPEIRILSELKWLIDEVNSRYKIDGVEIDIFLPNFNLGIEYDGSYWHKDSEDSDLRKNKFLLSQNINLIRVRHHPLKSLSKNDVVVINSTLEKKDLDEILKKIYPFIDNKIKGKINTYFDKSSFVNEELFKKYLSYFPSPFPENSLLKTHPEHSKEWDYDNNYPLKPENFTYGSGKKVWWLCNNGHSYESTVNKKTRKSGTKCPYCSGRKTLLH